MFKLGLLTSTAMTAVALLLSGAGAAQAQTDMHVASRDPNARFLCTYGQFLVSAKSSFHSGGQKVDSAWTHVAVPVKGKGQTVQSIEVVEEPGIYPLNPMFTAGIYSNTASGFPGKLIAGGTGQVGASCGRVSITIPATTLSPRTKYWIEETTQVQPQCPTSIEVGSVRGHPRYRPALCSGYSSYTKLYWIANPKTGRHAYVQNHYWIKYRHSSSSYTSPWRKQTTGPYFKLR